MQDFWFYLHLGWQHIISVDATDHQLFIWALVAIFSTKDFKRVLILVTAFTLGHSITLALSILDWIRFSSQWIEFLIPCTIAFTALDNLIFSKTSPRIIQLNYILALLFGLIHGMGFANSVRITLASEQQIALPLLSFNLGLEFGQILIVAIVLGLHYVLVQIFKFPNKYWIMGTSLSILCFALFLVWERIPQ